MKNRSAARRKERITDSKETKYDITIAGNPNVGKSTIFNALTGMKQHTGNWPGKTVVASKGRFDIDDLSFVASDIPGTYSLITHSKEEEAARDLLCFEESDLTIIVCDATCIERNMNLALQILEIKKQALLCVNLLDEASKKGIEVDLRCLSANLGIPVVGAIARKKRGLDELKVKITETVKKNQQFSPVQIEYPIEISEAAQRISTLLSNKIPDILPYRWLAVRLLESFSSKDKVNESLYNEIKERANLQSFPDSDISEAVKNEISVLKDKGYDSDKIIDSIAGAGIETAHSVCESAVRFNKRSPDEKDRLADKLFTGKKTAYPIMLLLLLLILWITIYGANYPSTILYNFLFTLRAYIDTFFAFFNSPPWLRGIIVDGAYTSLAWIVSVMLPPMAIFFPLFTILEDSGYLPRVAFNLDKHFKKCKSCGKQALTMCMGFGCNAVGVVGCRIIDSPRERLIAVLTNSFVPCNGRFPMLISILTMFFVSAASGFTSSLMSAMLLSSVIIFGIFMTFLVSHLLSLTLLKGMPSAFTLELPPYRSPQIGKVILRSITDRTVFVLGRAVISAIPAGVIIWLMANLYAGDRTLLSISASFLDPFARLMGLDGVILMAFILGLPANEIIVPIILMAYLSKGTMIDYSSLTELKALLISNGWSYKTAICTMLFSLMHWPCATTILTIKKETGSIKWTIASVLIPTFCGILLCMLVNLLFYLIA